MADGAKGSRVEDRRSEDSVSVEQRSGKDRENALNEDGVDLFPRALGEAFVQQ